MTSYDGFTSGQGSFNQASPFRQQPQPGGAPAPSRPNTPMLGSAAGATPPPQQGGQFPSSYKPLPPGFAARPFMKGGGMNPGMSGWGLSHHFGGGMQPGMGVQGGQMPGLNDGGFGGWVGHEHNMGGQPDIQHLLQLILQGDGGGQMPQQGNQQLLMQALGGMF